MIKKKRPYLNLSQYPVYIEDDSDLSPNFFDITSLPNILTAGINAIYFKVNSENFTSETSILIEILDSANKPIYYEFPDFISEDKSRMIAVYIYDDTAPGDATITIMGQTDKLLDGESIPQNLQNVPNIRWKTIIPIEPTKRNNTDIYFESDSDPLISIEEKIRPHMDRVDGTDAPATQSAAITYKLSGITPSIEITDTNEFSPDQLGARIKFTPTNAVPNSSSIFDVLSKTFYANIKSIETAKIALLSSKYYIDHTGSRLTYVPSTFTDSAAEIHYDQTPVYSLTQNSRSLALVTINDLHPISGDIHRIKAFYKSKGSAAGWELIDDVVIKESDYNEILIDTSSVDVKTRIGEIANQTTINNYWLAQLYTRQTGKDIIDPPTLEGTQTLTYDSGSKLFRSFYTTGSSTTYPEKFIKIFTSGSLGLFNKNFDDCGEYTLQLNAYGIRSTTIGDNRLPYVEFYMSGSAFDYKQNESGLGKKIGEIDIQQINPGSAGTDFRFTKKSFSFISDKNGIGVLYIKINAGQWYFSDISIIPSADFGFTPCQTKLLIPIPTNHINDELDFKFEYYDYENKQSKIISYADNNDFAGGNTYIGGANNMLTGSLYVGKQLGSGVEIRGIKGGLVRSIGYTGFESASIGSGSAGFAIWSGSDMTDLSSEDYDGIGLEMHAGPGSGSFKFRTYPTPQFDVISPRFYFGNNSQYVSGSNGNIEIKSADFWLKPNGQITGSGARIQSGSLVMLDTSKAYTDAVNVGRQIYSSNSESRFSALSNTEVEILNFPTYILPGETSIQTGFMYRGTNNDVSSNNLLWNLYIESASNTYNVFTGSQLVNQSNKVVGASSTEQGFFNNKISDIYTSSFALFQGKLCKVTYKVKTQNAGNTDVTMSQVVVRTGRKFSNVDDNVVSPPEF